LQLAVDDLAEIEYLAVGEIFDELAFGRGRNQVDMEIMEPVGANGDTVAIGKRGGKDLPQGLKAQPIFNRLRHD
jgi:hypothetical protein